jgi:hypothetical protein
MAKQSGLCCLGEHTQMVPSWNFLVDLSPAFPSGGNSVPTEGPRSHRLCCCHLSLPLWSSHLPEVPGKAGGQSARWKQLVFRGLLLGQETLSKQTILTYSVFPELGVGLGSATCGYETVGKSKTSGPQAPPGRWVTALSLRCRKDCG